MKKEQLHSTLFIALIAVLLLPAFQQMFHLFPEPTLAGASIKADYKPLNTKYWLDGSYQENTDKWLNETFGFRPAFVRLNNQLEYSLLGKINAKNVYEGSNHFLYRFYAPGMKYNTNFRGKEWLSEKTDKLKFVQDTLEKLGKHIIIAIAPAKHYYHAANLPPENSSPDTLPNNYKQIVSSLIEQNANMIDLNDWFLKAQDTIKIPVYAKGGIHWTQLASFVAMDSIMHYMQHLSNEKYPEISWQPPVIRKKPWAPDVDIYNALNIYTQWDEFPLQYGALIEDSSATQKPKVIVIADSYFHAPSWSSFPKKYFSENSEFWYYNKEVYNNDNQKIGMVADLDLGTQINDHNYFIVLSTVMNLENFAWNFIDQMYDYYTGKRKKPIESDKQKEEIQKIIRKIKADKNWLNSVNNKAKRRGIPLDSMLILDARFMLNNR